MTSLLRRLVSASGNAALQIQPANAALHMKHANTMRIANSCLSTSITCSGMEEFFPPGVYEGEDVVDMEPHTGRVYRFDELRARSNVDLHKLWFVCLKEKNMLMTIEGECERLNMPMPGPTRKHKVRTTMHRIKRVVNEREIAIEELELREWEFDRNPPQATVDDGSEQLGVTNKFTGPAPAPSPPGFGGMWIKDVLAAPKKTWTEKILTKIKKLDDKSRNPYLPKRDIYGKLIIEEVDTTSPGCLVESGWQYEMKIARVYKRVEKKSMPFEEWMKPVLSAKKRKELEERAAEEIEEEPVEMLTKASPEAKTTQPSIMRSTGS